MNLNSQPTNFFKIAASQIASGSPTVSISSFTNVNLDFNFLSPQASQLARLPSTCITPFYDTPRFITSYNSPLAPGATTELTSSNISLNGVPDKVAIFIRKSSATVTDPDFSLSITGVKINFNNRLPILA